MKATSEGAHPAGAGEPIVMENIQDPAAVTLDVRARMAISAIAQPARRLMSHSHGAGEVESKDVWYARID
jgi:hypothetical protein